MKNQAEQLAREIAREALFLPERWRVWLLERLREDLNEIDWEQHHIDVIGARMSAAIKALERVTDHLGLEDQEARLRLTMSEFDAAPESVRDGWRARQVSNVLRGSWSLAKGVAFADERLPVVPERQWERAEGLARKRREGKLTFISVKTWLDTKPKKKTFTAYDTWARSRNKELAAGEKPIPLAKTLVKRWQVPMAEIIKVAEEGRVPGEDDDALPADDPSQPDPPRITQPAQPLNLDLGFYGQQIRIAREARGWTLNHLFLETQLDPSQISRIEKGEVRNPSFQTVAKLAHVLGLSLSELTAGPSTDEPSSS